MFGSSSKKNQPPPNLTDAITKVDSRVDNLGSKIRALEVEIARIKDQIAKLPPTSPNKELFKQQAIRCLQQKKTYEQQVLQMRQQSFNMEQTAFATESLKDTQTTIKAMQHAAKDMKRQMHAVSLDKVENLQDELQELMESSNEIQEIMSRSYVIPDGIDDAELEAELDALEGGLDADTSYLDTFPPLPAATSRVVEREHEQELTAAATAAETK